MTYRRALLSILLSILFPSLAFSQTHRLVVNTGHTNAVHSVAFSPDGKTFASGGGNLTVKIWDYATCREIRTFLGHPLTSTGFAEEKVGLLAFSPDGKYIAGASESQVTEWDVSSGAVLGEREAYDIRMAAFTPDGRALFECTDTDQGLACLREVLTGKEVQTDRRFDVITWAALSPDGKSLAIVSPSMKGGKSPLRLFDSLTGKETKALKSLEDSAGMPAFSQDGKFLAAAFDPSRVKVCEIASGKLVQNLRFISSLGGRIPIGISHIAFSRDGKMLAAAGYDLETMGLEGKTVAVGSWDFPVKIWDIQSNTAIHTLPGHRFTTDHGDLDSFGTIVDISPDGTTIATGGQDRNVMLWDTATGGLLAILSGHSCGIASLSFSPSGKVLYSMTHDGNVRIWSVDGPRSREIASVHFFPDGSWAVIDPGGRFDASDPEVPHLHWVEKDEVQPLSRHAKEFHRPGLLAEVLARR